MDKKGLISFVILLALFSLVMGVVPALALLVFAYIHELFHKYMVERAGLEVPKIEFKIYGASTTIAGLPKTYKDVFSYTLAGPASGVVLCLIFYAAYLVTGIEMFIGFIGLAAMINLFNLLPITVADGGRIFEAFLSPLRSVNKKIIMVCLNLLAAAAFYFWGIDKIFIAILLVWGLKETLSTSREEMIAELRIRLRTQQAESAGVIAIEKQMMFPDAAKVAWHQLVIDDAEAGLREYYLPSKMNFQETCSCCFSFILVAVILGAFYYWAGTDFLKFFV